MPHKTLHRGHVRGRAAARSPLGLHCRPLLRVCPRAPPPARTLGFPLSHPRPHCSRQLRGICMKVTSTFPPPNRLAVTPKNAVVTRERVPPISAHHSHTKNDTARCFQGTVTHCSEWPGMQRPQARPFTQREACSSDGVRVHTETFLSCSLSGC